MLVLKFHMHIHKSKSLDGIGAWAYYLIPSMTKGMMSSGTTHSPKGAGSSERKVDVCGCDMLRKEEGL